MGSPALSGGDRAGSPPPGAGAGRSAGRARSWRSSGSPGWASPACLRVHPLAPHPGLAACWRVASVSYGKATPYFPVIDLLKRYCPCRGPRRCRAPSGARSPGSCSRWIEALRADPPGAAGAAGRAGRRTAAWQALDPPQRRQRTLEALKRLLAARKPGAARCSWSSRTCTGSIRKRRPCSTAWSRACPRPACCSWSTTGPSISTAGAARPTTRSSGSTRCRRRAPTSLLQALLGDDAGLQPLKQRPDRAHRGQPLLPGRERAHAGRDAGCWWASAGPIAWQSRSTACRCRPRCRRCWRRASTGCRPRTSACCRPPRSSAPRCPCRCCRPSPSCPRRRCTGAWRTCRPPSSSMRRASFPSASTPSSMPSRMRWPTAASCRSGGACCMPASSRPWRRSLGTGWPSRSNGWPTMPCGGRCGTRPWRTAGRQGRRPWRGRPTARPWGTFEQALSALPHLPETARHARAGHRSPARPALGALAVWRSWAYPGVSARGRGPRGGPRRPASAGTGLGLSVSPFPLHGRV